MGVVRSLRSGLAARPLTPIGVVLAVAVLVVASCGEGVTQADVDAVSTERDELADALEAAGQRVDELEAEVAKLNDDLEKGEKDAADSLRRQAEVSDLVMTDLSDKLAAAEAEIENLRIRFDPELKAEAQTAWASELDRACKEAGAKTGPIGSYVDWDDEWSPVGTKAELVAAVTECAQPLRDRSEAEKLSDECELVQIDQVTKSPDALAGNCYEMYVIPWQWDSRTGECSFLGSFEPSNLGTQRFRYDGDGIFTAPDTICKRDLTESDQDDVLHIWADLLGSLSYDTAAGGTNEVPQFMIRRAELVRKA